MYIEKTIHLLENLKEIGLSASEANIYLTLLTIGANPVSTIAKKININRSSCYEVIKRLINKGFINKIIKNNISYFFAEKPEIMLIQLSNKKERLEQKIIKLEKSLKDFEKIQDNQSQKPSVIFFEGKEGILNIMEDTLNSKEELRAYASLNELAEILPNYLEKYYKRRSNKGIFVRAIYPANKNSYNHKQRDKEENRESRLIPPELDLHLDIIIYDDKVVITSLKEKFGLLIKSKSLATAQKKIFDIIWDGTKKYDKVLTSLMKQQYSIA